MRKINIALIIGFIMAIIFAGTGTLGKSVEGISDKVLRLHILANSDSAEDQQLKLKVRDAVLEKSEVFLTGDYSRLEAEKAVVENMDSIVAIAEGVIKENGYDYDVKAQLVNMEFDERVYDDITFPAGSYDALRITIGEAKGKNWWCVMYPQFCISASISEEDLEFFEGTEMLVLQEPEKFKFRFKILEFFKSLGL